MEQLTQDGVKKIHLRIFFITFLTAFLLVATPHVGSALPSIVSPIAKDDIFETAIRPKLEYKANSFALHRTHELISKAHAVGAVDDAKAYIIVDYDTGTIIAEKGTDHPLPMASLTKIMTAVVALDLADPSEVFTVSEEAAEQIPTKIGVEPGERLTLDELIHAAMLTSANDAVEVIKEGVDEKYGAPVFMKAMNEKARFLGLKNTSFTNPQGFDNPDHYSSVADLSVLTHYALTQYPYLAEVVKKDYAFLPENGDHGQFDLYNWNGLVGVYPGAFGVKIGNTGRAKKTTVVAAEREGKRMMVTILGAPDVLARDVWASQLLDYGFEEVHGLEPVDVSEEQLTEKYSTWKYW